MEKTITAIQVAAIPKALVQESPKYFVVAVGATTHMTVELLFVTPSLQLSGATTAVFVWLPIRPVLSVVEGLKIKQKKHTRHWPKKGDSPKRPMLFIKTA
jgi:hypothetical protein